MPWDIHFPDASYATQLGKGPQLSQFLYAQTIQLGVNISKYHLRVKSLECVNTSERCDAGGSALTERVGER